MNVGLTPDQFWEMDEVEVILCINGYQNRIDDQREALAPFVAALINSDRPRSKQITATKLFDRKKKEKHLERQREAATTNVVDLEAKRREVMADVKRAGVPILPPSKPN